MDWFFPKSTGSRWLCFSAALSFGVCLILFSRYCIPTSYPSLKYGCRLGTLSLIAFSLYFLIQNQRIQLNPRTVLAGLTSLFLLFWIPLNELKYRALSFEMADLGNMDQALYNTIKGDLLFSTDIQSGENMSRLGWHFEPIYFLLSPFSLLGDARIWLHIQTLILALLIPFSYRLARALNCSTEISLAFSVALFCYPALQFSVLFGLHGDTLSIVPLMAFLVYCLEGKILKAGIACALALACKEIGGLAILSYGLWLWWLGSKRKIGINFALLGTLYFVLVFFFIMPLFNQGEVSPLFQSNYSSLGSNHGAKSIISTLYHSPEKYFQVIFTKSNFENVIHLLAPLAFLSLLTPMGILGLFSGSLLWMKDLLFQLDIFNHHSDSLIPLLFANTALVTAKFQAKYSNFDFAALLLSFSLVWMLSIGPSPLGQRFWRDTQQYRVTTHDTISKQAIKLIPKTAKVSSSGHLAPYLSHRETLWIFPRPYDFSRMEYVILDTLEQIDYDWHRKSEVLKELQALIHAQTHQVLFDQDGILVFRLKEK